MAKLLNQDQEAIVLDAAITAIEATSLSDFTMAAVAKAASLSMGSIYKHVQSKEDVLVAVATRMKEQKFRIFSGILSLPLTMPERLLALVLLSPQNLYSYSFGVHLEMLVGNEAVLQRASARWLDTMIRVDERTSDLFVTTLRKSWDEGELQVTAQELENTMDVICTGLWAMSVGFIQIAYQNKAQARWQPERYSTLPFPLSEDHPIVRSASCLINAHAWQQAVSHEQISNICSVLNNSGYR